MVVAVRDVGEMEYSRNPPFSIILIIREASGQLLDFSYQLHPVLRVTC